MWRRLLALSAMFVVFTSSAMGHGGKTDGKGGHTDRSTGEYHYHHGYSAHQHPNGVCPYDFDDKTGESSGASSSGGSSRTPPRPTATPAPTPVKKEETIVPIPVAIIAGIVLFCIMAVRSNSKQAEIRKEVQTRDNKIRELEKELDQQKTLVRECSGKVKETIRNYETMITEYKSQLGKQTAIVDEEPIDLQAAYEIAKAYGALGEFYMHHTLREMAGIPKEYTVGDDGMPREVNTLPIVQHKSFSKQYWGDTFTRFVSSSSAVAYHSESVVYHRPSCQHAHFTVNVAALHYARPCGTCRPAPIPNLDWFERYKVYKNECDMLGINARLD